MRLSLPFSVPLFWVPLGLTAVFTPVAWKRGWRAYALIPVAGFAVAICLPGLFFWYEPVPDRQYMVLFMIGVALRIVSALGLIALAAARRSKQAARSVGLLVGLCALIMAPIIVVFALNLGSGTNPGPVHQASAGTPVTVSVEAVYVDDEGQYLHAAYGDKYDSLGVTGVQVMATDGAGNYHAGTTAAVWQGRPEAIWLEMLSGHTYTVTASFNESSRSIHATIIGKYCDDSPEHKRGGSVTVEICHSSNTVRSIRYRETMFA